MKIRLSAILIAGLLAALAAAAENRKAASAKTTTAKSERKSAEAKAAPAKAAAKAGTPPAEEAGAQSPGRVTQVFTPKLPPLPEGAVQIDKYSWRATDKEGKVWIYRRTPFGFSRYEAGEQPVEEPVAGLIAMDKGDTVEFQRKTPFGVSKWTRKKSELDENEAAALKRATAPDSAKKAQE